MIDSRCFERIGVSVIARISDSIAPGWLTFGIGVTFAFFQRVDIARCLIEQLYTAQIGWEIRAARSLNTQLRILSGPEAFDNLVDMSLRSTSSTLMVYSCSIISSVCEAIVSIG